MLVQWEDSIESWANILDLNKSLPPELEENIVANEISEELAFIW